jgi:hypothetical protein
MFDHLVAAKHSLPGLAADLAPGHCCAWLQLHGTGRQAYPGQLDLAASQQAQTGSHWAPGPASTAREPPPAQQQPHHAHAPSPTDGALWQLSQLLAQQQGQGQGQGQAPQDTAYVEALSSPMPPPPWQPAVGQGERHSGFGQYPQDPVTMLVAQLASLEKAALRPQGAPQPPQQAVPQQLPQQGGAYAHVPGKHAAADGYFRRHWPAGDEPGPEAGYQSSQKVLELLVALQRLHGSVGDGRREPHQGPGPWAPQQQQAQQQQQQQAPAKKHQQRQQQAPPPQARHWGSEQGASLGHHQQQGNR